jgi:hypothetical protein
MRMMRRSGNYLLIFCVVLAVGCSQKGEQVYRTWDGPERSNMVIVTLRLGSEIGDVSLRDTKLARSQYGSIELTPGNYTMHEEGDASIGFTIRPMLIDTSKARAAGELVLGHTYVLRGGKSEQSGGRALWIEDARSGEIFIDTR